jgi:hypothetical protein
MATIVGVWFIEDVVAAKKLTHYSSSVGIFPGEFGPQKEKLIGIDAETSLVWVGGLHNPFIGSVATCISQVNNTALTTDPYSSTTGGWFPDVFYVQMTLDVHGGFGASRLKVNLWA